MVPRAKVDFVRELFQHKKLLSIYNVINMFKNRSDFKKNLNVFTKENIEAIVKLTMTVGYLLIKR